MKHRRFSQTAGANDEKSSIYEDRGFLSTEILQVLLQTLTGEEDTTLDSTDRKTQLFSYFTILETGHIHGERYTILLRQRMYDLADFLQVIIPFSRLKA